MQKMRDCGRLLKVIDARGLNNYKDQNPLLLKVEMQLQVTSSVPAALESTRPSAWKAVSAKLKTGGFPRKMRSCYSSRCSRLVEVS